MTAPLSPDSLRELARRFQSRYEPGHVRGVLVAGSGLSLEVPDWEPAEVVDLADLLPFPMHALPGHQHTITLWRRNGETLLVMNGRLHLYQGYSAAEVVAPVRLAALAGAEVMIATNASGALDPTLAPGSLVVVSDHLNLQGVNPLVGAWGRELGPQFPDMTAAYDRELRARALAAARAEGFATAEGVYAAVLGPSFETPAEVRMLRQLGASVVGMSTVPEVIAARHMGLRVLALSLASNPAAGITEAPLSHEEVLEAGRQAAARLRKVMGRLVHEIFG